MHPGLAAVPGPGLKVLVLGGGDGLAVREILKYPQVAAVTLVDLDPRMTQLFTQHPLLARLNGGALSDPRVRTVNDDAFQWLDREAGVFDFIVIDFPAPTGYGLGKLYTDMFYKLVERHLSPRGLAVVQATSPLYARRSFWSIVHTIESVGLKTAPYHALVPSFGEWGYIIASRQGYAPPDSFMPGLRFVEPGLMPALFQFPRDMARVEADVNRLNTQALVHYYEAEWKQHAP